MRRSSHDCSLSSKSLQVSLPPLEKESCHRNSCFLGPLSLSLWSCFSFPMDRLISSKAGVMVSPVTSQCSVKHPQMINMSPAFFDSMDGLCLQHLHQHGFLIPGDPWLSMRFDSSPKWTHINASHSLFVAISSLLITFLFRACPQDSSGRIREICK